MKKTLFALAALAMLAACNKAEVIKTTPDNLIGFNSPFVENATKALNNDYSGTKELTGFKVYGTVQGNLDPVNIFKDVQIIRNNKDFNVAWDYANASDAEYWVPGCTYNFAAIVDGTVPEDGYTTTGMPAKINYTVGEGDLLYATATASTVGNTNPGLVAFTFDHLLSKVYFTVNDQFTSGDYTYTMTPIQVSEIPSEGVYTVDGGTWAAGASVIAAENALDFGTFATPNAHLIIPVEQTLNIKFSYDIVYKGTSISTINVDEDLTYTFAKKTVYNINVTLPALGNKIEFTVTAKPGDFTSGGSVNVQ
jgi:hypothetical protein